MHDIVSFSARLVLLPFSLYFRSKIGAVLVFKLPIREFLERIDFGDEGASLLPLLHFEPLFRRENNDVIFSEADKLLLLRVNGLVC